MLKFKLNKISTRTYQKSSRVHKTKVRLSTAMDGCCCCVAVAATASQQQRKVNGSGSALLLWCRGRHCIAATPDVQPQWTRAVVAMFWASTADVQRQWTRAVQPHHSNTGRPTAMDRCCCCSAMTASKSQQQRTSNRSRRMLLLRCSASNRLAATTLVPTTVDRRCCCDVMFSKIRAKRKKFSKSSNLKHRAKYRTNPIRNRHSQQISKKNPKQEHLRTVPFLSPQISKRKKDTKRSQNLKSSKVRLWTAVDGCCCCDAGAATASQQQRPLNRNGRAL